MVTTPINVSVSETYDLKTQLNKMTLIGIHTPSSKLIEKTYPGLCMNARFLRIKSIDVVISAVSQLAISPDQVGEDATKIAPQDMLNPILYKAVSNEAMSAIEARLYGLSSGDSVGEMATYTPGHVSDLANEFNMYYALLSNRDGFKVAHPQQGLSMKGLVPLVFERYYNVGVNAENETTYPNYSGATLQKGSATVKSMRGKAHPMPRFNTTYITAHPNTANPDAVLDGSIVENGMNDGLPVNASVQCPADQISPLYVGLVLMPPSARTIMYYRMRVTAHLEFSEIRPIQEITHLGGLNEYGGVVYHSDYSLASKNMTATTELVDVKDADIEKIMEGR